MKCRKCGAELTKDDLFCGECGTKVEGEDTAETKAEETIDKTIDSEESKPAADFGEKSTSREVEQKKDTPKDKKKTGMIIGIIVAIVIVVAAAIFFMGPKEVEMEAKDLATIMYSDEVKQYAGDTLIVHGLLFKDTRSWTEGEEGYYAVCEDPTDENNESIVLFKYEQGIADDIGTGSEIIVTGTLDEDGMALIATDVEVVKKVDPVLIFKDVDELLAESNDLINKKVRVVGLLDNTFEDGVALLNDAEDNGIILQKLSKPKDMEYGIYTITGKFYYQDGYATIDVEEYELVEVKESVKYFDSLKELMAVAEMYRDEKISVNGWIEGAGASLYMMEDDFTIELRGLTQQEGLALNQGYSVITGELKGGVGDPYYILVEKVGE